MSNTPDLWESRDLPNGLTLELRAGAEPCLVLRQGDDRISVELSNVKTLVAALTDAAAELAELLASGGMHHA
jgi:hypothetical protein